MFTKIKVKMSGPFEIVKNTTWQRVHVSNFGRLVGWMVGWLIGWLVGYFIYSGPCNVGTLQYKEDTHDAQSLS